MKTPLLIAALVVAVPAVALGEEDARVRLLGAMETELARSIEKLQLKEYEAPYFIAYQIKDEEVRQVSGRYGAVFSDHALRDRRLAVDVRVGSYELDNSGGDPLDMFDLATLNSYAVRKDAPLDDDPRALRNALWLVTDEKYKAGLAAYLKKKSKRVYEVDAEERTASFSREKPSRFIQPPEPFAWDSQRAQRIVREVGGLFKRYPEIFDSDIKVEARKEVRYFASSEGSGLVTEATMYSVHIQAVTRAVDGQLLENSRDYYAPTEAELPELEVIKRDTAQMISELRALRTAPVIDPYTGPAILAPRAAGVLFHEVVGHRLEGDRQENDKEGRTFKGQIGRQVLPAFLSIIDDPTLREMGGRPLNGFYRYDDEGVPAQRVELVKDGKLQGFLMSRRPVKGFASSNGHGRAQGNRPPMSRMGNILVESARKVSYDKLKRMLVEEARRQKKPYALIIEDISGGNTNTSSYGYQAFKGILRLVYRVDAKTGREELVRGVEMVGTPLTTINKVIATGDEPGVFNGFCGAESGYVPVSAVVPAVLISELELQRSAQANERPPLLPSPWAIEESEAGEGKATVPAKGNGG
ncbi:MAG: TldD/PmbA family protein [Myxococcales bacterium]|jgi:TldD protein